MFGLICIGADIYYILLQTCHNTYPGKSTDGAIVLFHNQYILGKYYSPQNITPEQKYGFNLQCC